MAGGYVWPPPLYIISFFFLAIGLYIFATMDAERAWLLPLYYILWGSGMATWVVLGQAIAGRLLWHLPLWDHPRAHEQHRGATGGAFPGGSRDHVRPDRLLPAHLHYLCLGDGYRRLLDHGHSQAVLGRNTGCARRGLEDGVRLRLHMPGARMDFVRGRPL